jgi:protein TonB
MTSALRADVPDPFFPSLRRVDSGLVQQALHHHRIAPAEIRPQLGRRETFLVGAFVLVLHVASLAWWASRPEPVLPEVPVQIPPMTIEFAPPPPPEPVVEPVVEPPPVIDELAAKPPQPEPPKPKVQAPKPKPKPVPPRTEPTPAPKLETPPPPVRTAPPAPEPAPLVPPSASAGYLKNPAPDYPPLAQQRGWEGTVLLRVRVLPSGSPAEIQVQRSSGHDVLDAAATRAVKRWSFVPAKRGDQPQEGWVTVPLDFRLG